MTPLVRPASVSLLFVLALALGLAAVLVMLFAVPAHAQSSTPGVSIRTPQTRMPEGGQALFTITRAGGDISQPLTVRIYTWEPQHPRNTFSSYYGADYHNVTFDGGTDTATLLVNATDDGKGVAPAWLQAEVEPMPDSPYDRGFPELATITITDANDDVYVTISPDEAEVDEEESVDFELTRTGDMSSALTVSVRVDDPGEVMRGNHWTPAPDRPTSVEFAAGQDTATLSLETKDDQRDIPDQTLSVTIAGGDDGNGAGGFGYWLGYPHAAGVTVEDDDTAPDLALSISPEMVSEGGTLTVSVERPSGNTAEVLNGRIRIEHSRTWTDPDAPAHQTNPFEGNFHIPAGGTAWTLDIQATDNGQPENDWRYTVTLLPRDGVPDDEASQYWTVGGAAVARALDTAYIRITVTADQEAVYEGEEATFTLTRTGSLAQELTVQVVTAERAGTPEATNIQFQSVTFAAGSATATLALTAAEDDELEPDGDSLGVEVYVYPGAPYRGGDPDDAVTMVKDTGAIDIRTFQTRMREGAEALFTLTRADGAISQPLTVRVYTWEPQHPLNNEANGYFHGAAHHEVTFEAGAESAALVVSATGDGKAPGSDAWLRAEVDPPSGASYRSGDPEYVTIAIADADGPDAFVTIATAESEVDEGESVDFVLTRTGDTSRSLAVHVRVDDPGEVMRGNHWAPAPDRPTSVAFGVGEDSVMLSLETKDDQRDIPDQPVSVTIIAPAGSGYWLAYPHMAGFTVRDDDIAPELTVRSTESEVDEGGTFFVSVERPAGNTTEVLPGRIRIEHNRAWTDPNAAAHQTNPFEENFLIRPDKTGRLWQIEVPVNNLAEDEWQYTVTLLPREEVPEDEASQYWRVVGDGTATATVRDVGLPVITITANQESIFEGEEGTFTLSRTGGVWEPLTVQVLTWERRISDVDETRQEHQVTFEAGSATAIVARTIMDEWYTTREKELIALILPNPGQYRRSEDQRLFAVSMRVKDRSALLSIRADDQDSGADGEQDSITEGETATFTLTREGYIGRALAVHVSVRDPGYFMRGNHWQPVPSIQPVRFEAGEATAVLELPTRDDLRDVPDNSLTVTVEPDPDGYYTVSTAPGESSAAVTVRDNDVAPTIALSVDRTEITEGESFTLTVTRSGDTANPIELPLRFGPFGPPMSRIVGLGPGETQVSIPFHIEDDDRDEAEQDYYVGLAPYEGLLEDAMSQYWTVEGPRFLTVTVADNDLPLVGVEAARDSYSEGRIGAIRVFRANYVEDGGIVVNLRFIDTGNVIVQPHRQGVTGDRSYFIEDDEETNILIHLAEEDGDEADGSFAVQLLEGDGYRVDPQHSATSFVVLDNDPTPVLSVTAATVSEGGESIDFRVALSSTVSPPSLQTVTVDYATRDGAAVAGEDYTAVRGTLTLAPEATEGVISVPLLDDGWAEDLETFSLVVTSPSNAMLPDGQSSLTSTGTIEDDEPRVSVRAQSAQVMEGEPVTLILTRTGDTGEDLVFRLSIFEDHPSTFNGYSVPYVTIPAGQSTLQWDHATVDDDFDEADFTVSVSIIDYTQSTARTGYAWDGTYATATVTDNDLPVVTVEAVNPYGTIGDDVEFRFTREGQLTGALAASFDMTATGNSIAGATLTILSNYFEDTPPTTANFAAGESTATVRLKTNSPNYNTVTVELTLSETDSFRVGDPGSASILFVKGGLPVVAIASNGDVEEGQDVVFTLSRTGSPDSSLTVTMDLEVRRFVAYGSTDPIYEEEEVQVTFEAGEQTASYARATVDDELNKGNQHHRAVLHYVGGEGYYVGIGGAALSAGAFELENDIPTVWLTPATGEHYEDGNSRPAFTFHRDSYTSTALYVYLAVETLHRFPEPRGDEIEGNINYVGLEFLRPLSAGQSSNTYEFDPRLVGPLGGESRIRILLPNDALCQSRGAQQPFVNPWRTCNLDPRYHVGTPSSGVITVHNNFVGILIEADQSEVDEGQSATFTLTRVGGTRIVRGLSQTVRVAATQNGEFISGSTPQTVTFTGYPDVPTYDEGQQSVTVRIPTVDDTVYEADGAVTLTVLPAESLTENATAYEIGGSNGFDVPTSATIRVIDNDRPEMSISDVSAFESEGVIKFTVSVPAGPRDVSVDWATSDGSGDTAAIAGEDYTAASGALTIPAGETTGTITVMVMDDDLHENDETLTVQLSNAPDARLVESSATGTIKNDDFDQEVEIWTLATDRNLTEGETAMFTLRRQPPDGGVPVPGFGVAPLTVNIGVSQDGDFIAGDPPATVTFPANHLYAQLRVPTEDDQTAEASGSVTVSLADGAGYSQGDRNQATVNLQDNDVGISITGGDPVRENVESGITFTVSLSRAAPKPVTVDVTTVDGTATSDHTVTATSLGRDFEAKSQTLTFEAGQTQKTFTVTLVDDTFDEPREEFTAQLSNASDNARLLVPTATGMINDDEEKLVLGVYRTRQRVAEDRGAPVDFLLELKPAASSGATASEFEVRVNWSLERGTAIPGADYVDASGKAIIPPGAASATVEVSLVDDELLEAIFETFSFRINGAFSAYVDEDHESIEISIRDDDDVQADVAVATESVAEGADAEFTVSLSGALSTAPVEVTYTVSGTAGADDYTAPSGTLTIPALAAEATISITTLADDVEDDGETLIVTLTGATSHGRTLQVADTAAEATILDQGTLTVSITGGSATEGEEVQLTIAISPPPSYWVNVTYETVDPEGNVVGEALLGTDFQSTRGIALITGNDPSKTFTIGTIEDNLVEGDETFEVRIVDVNSRFVGAEYGPAIDIASHTAELTIIDDDVRPTNVTLTVTPDSVSESADGTPLSVTATLDGDGRLLEQQPVALSVSDGTAAEGEDYTAVPVMLYIPAGQASATAPVVLFPVDDLVAGGDKTVQVTAAAAGMTATPATVTITDNETPPTGVALTVSPGEVREDAGATDLEVTATLTGGDRRPVDTEVRLTVEGVSLPAEQAEGGPTTAATGADFAVNGVTLTIPAGEMTGTATLSLTPTDDPIAEGDERAQVTGAADGLTVTPAPVTIVDDDRETTGIELSVTPSEVKEDAGATDLAVTATLIDGDARGVDTEVALSVSGVTATETLDYTAQTDVTLTIPAGRMSHTATLTLTPVDDGIRESAEQVAVRGTNASAGLPVSGARVTIADNDADATAITLSLDRDMIPEDGGAQRLTVTGTLNGDLRSVDTRVTLMIAGQTATESDYTALPATLVIGAGQREGTATVVLDPTNDDIDEPDETLEVRGQARSVPTQRASSQQSVPQSDLTVSAAQVTITDDDTAGVTVTPTAFTVLEGSSRSYTVVLDTQPAADVTVSVSLPGGSDLSVSHTSLTFTASNWSVARTVTVTADEDNDLADDGEVTIGHTVSSTDPLYAAATADSVTVTVNDDDDTVSVTFSAAAYSVDEGGTVEVTVTLSAAPEREVTIPIVKTDEGEITQDDYSGVPESLTFGAADTEKSFTFSATQDDVDDDDESVKLTLGTLPAGVSEGTTNTATVTITDDDVPAVTVSFGAATYAVAEGSNVTVKVTLSAAPERSVTVPLTASNQAGASAADYSGIPANVVFASGETEQTFTVAATQDTVDDDGESVKLTFGTLPTAVTAGTTATSTVSIIDDDVPAVTVSFGAATYAVAEGSNVTVKVTLSAAPERSVTVPLAASNQGGASAADYSGIPANMVFASGDTEQTFTVAATQDTVDDDGESVKLTLGTLPVGVSEGTTNTATVNITDDDVPAVTVSFSAATYAVAEGSNVTVKVTLSAAPERSVTVPLTASNQGGASAADYSGIPANVVFASGDTEQTFTVAATQDTVDDDGESVKLTFGTLPTAVTAGTTATSTVTITDDDVPAVTVSFGAATYAVAEGSNVTVKVTLSAAPERSVTVPLTASNQAGASAADYSGIPANVVFNSGETEQTFNVAATQDTVDDDGESVKLTFGTLPTAVTAGTAGTTATSTVSITDDDVPAVTVSFGAATYAVAEGSNVTVKVTLSAAPERSVTVPLTASNQAGASAADYSGIPANVTFAAEETEKSFTFTAAVDAVDDDGESVRLAFGTLPAQVTGGTTDEAVVSITDDNRGVTIDPTSFTVIAGRTNSYSVVLDTQPTASVTVTVSGHVNTDLSLDKTSLTFSADNWNTAQTVTVTADENALTRPVTLSHAISGADYGSVSADDATVNILAAPSSITIQVGVTVSQQRLSVVEGGSQDYSLVLNTVPTGDVTIDITLPSGTDLSLDSATLTFTTANWSTPQTITVSADEDDDSAADDPVQISHTISGGGYDNTPVPDVRVTITENDLFDAEARYRVLTRYGSLTEVELSEYIADGATGVTFALESCDDTRSDYYDSAAVENGKLRLASNTLGHIHGENTRGETVCTVTATSADGYEEREFRLYMVSDRTPTPLLVGDLTLVEARPTELDVQVALPEGAIAYVRLAWRKPGGQPIFRVVSGVTNETVLTIPGLEAGSEYDVRAYLMSFQSFDLYRAGNTGPERTLIPEGSPAVKWVTNLASSGLGKSQTITTRSAYGISVSIEDVEALEDVGSMSFDVTLDQASTDVVTLDWATSDGTAEAPGDYEATTSGQLTFAAGQTKQTLEVPIVDDAVDEAEEETFTVTLSNAANVDLGVASATGTITDNDLPDVMVSFGAAVYSVAEGSSVTVKVTLSAAPEREVTIPITATDQDGAGVDDYSGVPVSLMFEAADTSKSFTVAATQDTVDDDGESVKLAFSTLPAQVTGGTTDEAVVSITDDDAPASVAVSFAQDSYSVAEGSAVTITVQLDDDPEKTVTVPVSAAGQNGASAADYSGVPASVTFNSGDTSKSFTFSAAADGVDDDGESVKLAFGTLPTGVSAGTTISSTVTITDDDVPAGTVSLVLTPATIDESSSSNVSTVTAALATASSADTTVTISAPQDAPVTLSSNKTLTIVKGATTSTGEVTITAVNDAVYTGDREVTVSGAASNTVGVANPEDATLTITDDEVRPVTASFGGAAYSVAEGGTVDVTVTLDAAPEREVAIPITATDQGGASADDYSGVPASLTFGAADTSKSFTFSATQDSVDDDGESVKLAFGTLPAQVTGGATGEAVVSITDDDAPASVAVSFGQSTYSVAEGSAVTITVQLDDDPEKTVTVPLSAARQNGASAADYSGVPASVTFNSGDTEQTFTFSAAADGVDDDGESVVLGFGTLPTGVTAGTTSASTVTITDDDVPAVTVSFGAAAYSVAEGGTVDVTVTLDAAPEREVAIPITATDQGGASADDYSGVPASLTFGAADTSKSFTFSATQDSVDDDGESVKLAFGTLPAQVTGGATGEAVVSITDDDAPASVAVSFGQSTYSVAEGSAVTITVQLDDDPEKTVTVPLSAARQNGASAADYSGVPASVTFNSGDTEQTFTFSAAADGVDDDGESVALAFGTLPAGVTAGTTGTTTVSITDGDLPDVTASFGGAAYSVAEGGTVDVTVTLDAAPEREVMIPITATAQDGAGVDDYSGVPASVTFSGGNTSKSFTFSADDDGVDDDGESVKLTFGTLPAQVTGGATDEAVVSITDDDAPASVAVSFGQSTYSVAEGSAVTITVQLDDDPEKTVTVPLSAARQNGASAADYSGVPASVTFNSGDTEQTFSFTAVADAVDDDGESVALAFGTLPAGVTAGTTGTATVSITDGDVPAVSVSFEQATYAVAEGSNVTVTVTLSADPERTVTVPLTASNQGGASADDYSGVPANVVFNSGDTEQTFIVAATQDTVDDDGESVKLTFGTLPAQVTGGATDEAVVSITDGDLPDVTVSFGAATYTVAEGSSVTVKVTLSADPEREVTIPLTATENGGISEDDYSGVPASVTFGAADTEKSFTFSATQDDEDDDDESVKLTFGTLPTGVTAGTTASSTVSITDDDVLAGTVSLVLTPGTIDESGSSNVSTVTATLATASSADTTVTISAPQDAPVTLSSNKTLTIVKGATTSTGEVTITAVNDAVYTGDREVTVSGAASNTVGVANPEDATLTITDDEVRPVTVSFGQATYSVAEGSSVMVTVTLDAAPERDVTIPITAADQDGAGVEDYSGVPESVTFGAADTSKSFSFAATQDGVDDDGESVKLAFGTLPDGVTAGTTNTATVSILEADAGSPSIQAWFSSPSYSATEGGDNAQVTVLLSSQPQSTVDIPLTATVAHGATEDDWSGVPASLTFSPGDTSQTFTVIATDDDVEDDGEMVHIGLGTLPQGFAAGEPATATITLMNDDSGTSDSACPDAVWCAELVLSEDRSRFDEGVSPQIFPKPGWHFLGREDHYPGASLSDTEFTYRGKSHSLVLITVSTPPFDYSSCISILRIGFLDEVDLTGLRLHVDDMVFPISAERITHPNSIQFVHPYFYSLRNGSTVRLSIEESETASPGGPEVVGTEPLEPRCVTANPYPLSTPQNGLVGIEVYWQEPSFDGAPDILRGQADVDGYRVQWKQSSDSWDDSDAVSEHSMPYGFYDVIIDLTEGVEYSVRVIATNEFGDSAPSEEVTATPREVIRPELSAATVNGGTLTLTFNETLDATSAPEIDSFEVMAAGSMLDVNEATVEGSAVVLTLASAVGPDDEVELNYFPAWYIEERRIQDEAGNIALGFVDQSVTNDTEAAAQAQAAEEVTPLTASFSDVPASHDGQSSFTFRIAFSEAIATSYEVVRDQSLEVTGGSVTQARRIDGRSDLWEITMEPGSNADVAVILRPDLACDAEGAICTDDGKRLSNGLALLVPGPVVRQEPEPNRPATGSPTVSGAVQVGETLRASTSGIADADGLDNAVFTYQWIADGAEIDGATGATYTVVAVNEGETIRVRVAFTDDAGNRESLTSAATAPVASAPVEPLTVTLENTPASHNGADAFTFELRFSEEVELSYRMLRDHSLTVTGGTVTKARRLDKPSNVRWEIHVVPDSSATVTVVLPITTDCNATGAICTEDGRMLSNRLELTVSGPGQ